MVRLRGIRTGLWRRRSGGRAAAGPRGARHGSVSRVVQLRLLTNF